MKLAIIAVYMLKKENQSLLDLHLRQIRRYTTVPYTIYASVNKLLPELRASLECQSDIKICDIETTDLCGSLEHSYYLEKLIQFAIKDNASHIVSMHVDSFPIRAAWAKELIRHLQGKYVLATVSRNGYLVQSTCCLFFRSEFYLECQPKMLISDTDRSTVLYKQFCHDVLHHPTDSGGGFVYTAYARGFSWHILERTNVGEDDERYYRDKDYNFGSIYGDMVFHLEGAYRFNAARDTSELWLLNIAVRLFWELKRIILKMASPRFTYQKARLTFNYVRNELFQNPDEYLQFLRTGKRSSQYDSNQK